MTPQSNNPKPEQPHQPEVDEKLIYDLRQKLSDILEITRIKHPEDIVEDAWGNGEGEGKSNQAGIHDVAGFEYVSIFVTEGIEDPTASVELGSIFLRRYFAEEEYRIDSDRVVLDGINLVNLEDETAFELVKKSFPEEPVKPFSEITLSNNQIERLGHDIEAILQAVKHEA